MNTNNAVEPERVVIRVPTWVAVIASALVLTVAYAIYRYITGGNLR
jgi:type VI protein secretion system component VasF